jgi:hypothetical protein
MTDRGRAILALTCFVVPSLTLIACVWSQDDLGGHEGVFMTVALLWGIEATVLGIASGLVSAGLRDWRSPAAEDIVAGFAGLAAAMLINPVIRAATDGSGPSIGVGYGIAAVIFATLLFLFGAWVASAITAVRGVGA